MYATKIFLLLASLVGVALAGSSHTSVSNLNSGHYAYGIGHGYPGYSYQTFPLYNGHQYYGYPYGPYGYGGYYRPYYGHGATSTANIQQYSGHGLYGSPYSSAYYGYPSYGYGHGYGL